MIKMNFFLTARDEVPSISIKHPQSVGLMCHMSRSDPPSVAH